MELECTVQNYAWGKLGHSSIIARLIHSADPTKIIEENKPYAELWMGTHPSGPSFIKNPPGPLKDWIDNHLNCLGSKETEIFGPTLPFLFKVLSINTALSIQAHPNKKHAEELHAKFPDLYKDSNYKPELAVALTPFEALCGFRPVTEIKDFFRGIPELKGVIGCKKISQFLACSDDNYSVELKDCYSALMRCSSKHIAQSLSALLSRVKALEDSQRNAIEASLLERLAEQYPNDVGCFSIYFLNVIKLQPGESVYLGPNIPHAYINGDCIECMACSDNVVRAGLTPKFIDIDTLCNMLVYEGSSAKSQLLQPHSESEHIILFRPPVQEFTVAQIRVPASKGNYTLPARSSASILIVISGKGTAGTTQITKGRILFLSANEEMNIQIRSCLTLYQAFSNV